MRRACIFCSAGGGLASFGHAAYFGLGSYGAAIALKAFGLSMETAIPAGILLGLVGALVFGWFCVRLSGVYFAMLTLAFAQIAWSIVYQWTDVTGGDNGIIGVWPSAWAASPARFYWLTLALSARRRRAAARDHCSRRSAMRCGLCAIRPCARRRSASSGGACNGWAL